MSLKQPKPTGMPSRDDLLSCRRHGNRVVITMGVAEMQYFGSDDGLIRKLGYGLVMI